MANEKWVADAREILLDIERIYDDHYFRSYDQAVHDIFNAFRRIVRRHATFRTVEVVRCKDCKYWDKATANKKGFLICTASGMEIMADDFCLYGERKDNGKAQNVRDDEKVHTQLQSGQKKK